MAEDRSFACSRIHLFARQRRSSQAHAKDERNVSEPLQGHLLIQKKAQPLERMEQVEQTTNAMKAEQQVQAQAQTRAEKSQKI